MKLAEKLIKLHEKKINLGDVSHQSIPIMVNVMKDSGLSKYAKEDDDTKKFVKDTLLFYLSTNIKGKGNRQDNSVVNTLKIKKGILSDFNDLPENRLEALADKYGKSVDTLKKIASDISSSMDALAGNTYQSVTHGEPYKGKNIYDDVWSQLK